MVNAAKENSRAPSGRPVRTFRKLRLSLTDSCNFTCTYCVTGKANAPTTPQTPVGSFIAWVRAIHEENPLAEVRLTGGEPTLYRELPQLVEGLASLGISKIAMTTNGSALGKLARTLKDAGLQSVNVSLDALDESVFRMMGGKSPAAVFSGIDAALSAGLETKINTTLVAEMNDTQILPLLGWAQGRNIALRFLELMAMGHLHGEKSARFFGAPEILGVIGAAFEYRALPRAPHATAHYYELESGYRFGIIGNTSLPFCSDCDRLRLDSRGNIFGCLSSASSVAISGAAVDITTALNAAMQMKQAERFTGSPLVMREIGG